MECVNNKYGTNCDIECERGCLNNICDDKGECSCKSGFTGDKCDRCEEGKYGNLCDIKCPVGCENNKCIDDGKCFACKAGENRSNGFSAGYYGEWCDMKCSSNCLHSTCSREYGECSHGCKTGYKGANCSLVISHAVEAQDNKEVTIGVSVGGCSFIIIVILVITIVFLTKRLKRQETANAILRSNIKDSTNMSYAVVRDNELNSNNSVTTPVEVNETAAVYESLTASDGDASRLCSADYSSLELQIIPELQLPEAQTLQVDPSNLYYNVSAK
ncbi:laminin subunit gamma-1-like [Ruditapes philippinarum]|uniref:laminin subunit gamma-1-like n=1 Tax=Ruditapes philippinarum TaxID=129788 RepID=UPI00295BF255|nr:laminin subunit gamma-1-like [Ruditapes philippinarum]